MIFGSSAGGIAVGRIGALALTVTFRPGQFLQFGERTLDRFAREDAAIDVGGGALRQCILGMARAFTIVATQVVRSVECIILSAADDLVGRGIVRIGEQLQ